MLLAPTQMAMVLRGLAASSTVLVWPPPKPAAPPPPPPAAARPEPEPEAPATPAPAAKSSHGHGHGDQGSGGSGLVGWLMLAVLVLAWGSAELFGHEAGSGSTAMRDFLQHVTMARLVRRLVGSGEPEALMPTRHHHQGASPSAPLCSEPERRGTRE